MAEHALSLVKAEFDTRPTHRNVDEKSIFDHLEKTAPPPAMVKQSGNIAAGEKQALSVVEVTYLNAYVAHAPIETHSAIASFENTAKSRSGPARRLLSPLREELAEALKLPQAGRSGDCPLRWRRIWWQERGGPGH